jgi:hypothetical protein
MLLYQGLANVVAIYFFSVIDVAMMEASVAIVIISTILTIQHANYVI